VSQETIRLVVSLLGGGLVVAILNWVRVVLADRVSRHADFLDKQLHNLYGPLYFFAGLNQKLQELDGKLHTAYDEEYCGKNWSDDEGTQKSLDEQTTATIDVGNQYTQLIQDNNDGMVAVLKEHFALIDHEDSEMFQEFVLASVRHKVEFGTGKLALPLHVYRHLGDVVFYSPDWVSRINDRFEGKTNELKRLRGTWSWLPFT